MYTYTANNPLRYIDPSGHCFTEGLKKMCDDLAGMHKRAWKAIGDQAQKEWDYLVNVHSSPESAIDYWSMGTLTEIKDYIRVSNENPMSTEQWVRAAFIFSAITPTSKSIKITISPFANDWQTKGFHFMIDGVELAMKPGDKGGIVFKKVFSSTTDKAANSAIKKANELLHSQDAVKLFLDRATAGRDYLKQFGTDAATSKSGEMHFLIET